MQLYQLNRFHMKFLEKLVDFVLNSSKDPAKQSLAVRGALVAGFGIFTKAAATACALGAVCVAIDQGVVGQVIDAIVNVVFGFCTIVGSLAFLAGIARKVYYGVIDLWHSFFG